MKDKTLAGEWQFYRDGVCKDMPFANDERFMRVLYLAFIAGASATLSIDEDMLRSELRTEIAIGNARLRSKIGP